MIGLKYIRITPVLLSEIAAIDEFKGLWAGLERHTTALSLLGDVASYGQAFHKSLMDLKGQKIDANIVRVLHAGLMGEKQPSVFRETDYALEIPSDEGIAGALDTAAAEDIAPLLEKLLAWVDEALDGGEQGAQERMHPLLVIAVFASVFLQIAPFKDGNLKLARMLLVIYMLKSGYNYVPYVSFEPLMEARGNMLYEALKHNQASLEGGAPDWSLWLDWFFDVLSAQKDILYSRLMSEKKDLSHLPTLSARIMALFQAHQRLQMKEIIKLTNGRRATIKLRLQELLDGGYVKRYGAGRSTWYALD